MPILPIAYPDFINMEQPGVHVFIFSLSGGGGGVCVCVCVCVCVWGVWSV